MKIFIKVKPRSRTTFVKKISENWLEVSVKEPPKEGRANEATIKALAEYFNLPSSKIKLILGKTSKQKLFEIG